ncbi:hypothetical protein ACFWNT_43505 [Streptomyces sp. NPDC058409]|uniref:hypothetical protein n=1 Tax=Streptomyces sp. NPDC058409 TaxID=3346484 RepID=UPI003653F7CE
MNGKTAGVEGWTIVHSTRQRHHDDRFYGQFLGSRKHDVTGNTEWIVGRMYPGVSKDDEFIFGEWDYSKHFAGPRSTDNADNALKAYVEMSHDTFVWDRIFDQRVGETIDRHLAGPEVPGASKLAAGWMETEVAGHLIPAAGGTILLPFHEARYELLQYLRRTELSAKAHLTRGITVDRHSAVELVVQAAGPIRFEYGYNTYWLAADE